MEGKIQNPALPLIKEVREIAVKGLNDLELVAELLNTGEWIATTAASSAGKDSYLILLGRVV